MGKILNLDEMLQLSAEHLPADVHDYLVRNVEGAAELLARHIAVTTGTAYNDVTFQDGFGGLCATFYRLKTRDRVQGPNGEFEPYDQSERLEVYRAGTPQYPQRIKKVCATCGSDDVTHDATVRWDNVKGEWQTSGIFDNADCGSCGGECKIDDAPIDFDPFSIPKPEDRIEIARLHEGDIAVAMYKAGEIRPHGEILDQFPTIDAARKYARERDGEPVIEIGEL